MSYKDTSKFIALTLRHKPETIGISLDEHGWANVDELIRGVSKTHPLTMEILERIVAEVLLRMRNSVIHSMRIKR